MRFFFKIISLVLLLFIVAAYSLSAIPKIPADESGAVVDASASPQTETVISNTDIINKADDSKNLSLGNSKINAGIEAEGADIKDSKLNNVNTGVLNKADKDSVVNSGISVKYSKIKNSEISNINKDVTNTAENGSKINTGLAADNSRIKNTKLQNAVSNTQTLAKDNSESNSGVSIGK